LYAGTEIGICPSAVSEQTEKDIGHIFQGMKKDDPGIY
jgi:hypothetical protein